jgi:hypothetical protein
MLHEVVRVTALPHYRLAVEFRDGISGTIDLSGDLEGEIFEPLRDEGFFRQVSVDKYGAITWPNGADLAPDALYAEIAGGSSSDRRPKLASEPDQSR